jgi:2,3-bisphosphoglycerate-independent phosphoglycerate mutase
MYKGIARLVGMSILTIREGGERIEDEFRTVCENYEDYDFFYVHIKKPDSYGEDGNFDNKVKEIEEVDAHVPLLLDLEPEVLVVTGDHSTPTLLKSHSWHANPFMLHSRYSRVDEVREFSENACARGGLGRFYLVDAMPLMLAHALKLNKFGA